MTKKTYVKLPKNWGKVIGQEQDCNVLKSIQEQSYKLYLHDMKHLHPKVKPVTFKTFVEHAKKNWRD